MTNPIPEYIDKQKFLEWVKSECPSQSLSTCKFIHRIVRDIESGTFDDHSAQEEIASIKNDNRILKENYDAMKRSAEGWEQATIQAEEERNALLELLRYFVERTTIDHSYTHTPEYAKARSAIAKLEGSKPDKGLYREGNGE